MKLTLLKTICVGLFAVLSFSAKADCGLTSCWDYCTSSYIQVYGNNCGTSWDYSRSCYTAIGDCTGSTPKSCGGISCWDYCSGSYKYFSGANTCHQIFQGGCYAATASCE